MTRTRFQRQRSGAVLLSSLILPLALSPLVLHAHGNEQHAEPEIQDLTNIGPNLEGNSSESRTVVPGFQLTLDQRIRSLQTRQATPVVSQAQGGLWSAVEPWPLVAIHAALLPNGKVLAWDATPDDADDDPHTTDNFTTRVTLWDPVTNTHVATNNDTDTDLFCAGSAHLWDGRVLFAGGDSGTAGSNGPLSNTNIYDPETNTWRRAPNMNAPRWYSSVAALGNGEMLTFGGAYQPTPAGEVFQFDQTWRGLPITNPLPNLEDYQWLQATPDGNVLTFGPGNSVSVIETEGSGVYRPGPTRDNINLRDYGSYAMFDVGQILVAGGGDSTNSSVVIATDTQQTSDTGSMNVGRRQHNLTILADGSVLATGGNTDGTRFVSATGGTQVVELWNPASGRWTVMNPMFSDRQYHSIAMLLPDGRVLSAGGGICGDCNAIGYEEKNSEMYSPPYLFSADGSLAPRPRLTSIPEQVNYSQRVVIGASDAESIERLHLIKLSSVTHSQDQEQRLVPLEFERFSGSLSVSFPDSRYVAPPGHYTLFAVNSDGVPSVGRIIRLGHPRPLVGESVRHDLAANSVESFEYELDSGLFQVALNGATGVGISMGQSPAVSSTAQAQCQPSVVGGQTVCDFAIPSAGVWYLSLQSNAQVSYDFSTRLTPITSGTQPPPTPTVEPPATTETPPAPTTETPPVAPVSPSPPVSAQPGNENEVTGSTGFTSTNPTQSTSGVSVGGSGWPILMLLSAMMVLGRRYPIGILRT